MLDKLFASFRLSGTIIPAIADLIIHSIIEWRYAMTQPVKDLFNLKGKVAVVTGAAMGIGKAIASRLAESGASVVIADINLEAASITARELESLGFNVSAVKADASNVSDAAKTMEEAIRIFGDLDILVNNAGIYPFSPALDMKEEMWDKTIDINLKGVMFYSRAAALAMKDKNHGGKIINIASIDAFHPTGNVAHYNASKGGVVMLTKALAKEWAPLGILVNAVAPGSIATPGTTASITGLTPEQQKAMAEQYIARIPVGRFGEPDDIAKIVLFLASSAADYVVGTTIIADGGVLLS
ncbi:MAG: SDR family oxidoreductase [Dehalococcoidales bacterium]|nr:SDR family oxidoreductase [Dehalococcoidales bacterium]